eukprot:5286347-Amphidinium_carterae.1
MDGVSMTNEFMDLLNVTQIQKGADIQQRRANRTNGIDHQPESNQDALGPRIERKTFDRNRHALHFQKRNRIDNGSRDE